VNTGIDGFVFPVTGRTWGKNERSHRRGCGRRFTFRSAIRSVTGRWVLDRALRPSGL